MDRLIRKGLVEVEGEIVDKNGAKLKVRWGSSPIVDGFDYPPPPLLAAYHKPLGVVSSMRDERSRPDLSSVLPMDWQAPFARVLPLRQTPCTVSLGKRLQPKPSHTCGGRAVGVRLACGGRAVGVCMQRAGRVGAPPFPGACPILPLRRARCTPWAASMPTRPGCCSLAATVTRPDPHAATPRHAA